MQPKMSNTQGVTAFSYQLLRVILRYKLAAVLVVYSFLMIFDLKFLFPTLSELNTNYGDFTPAKIFQLTLGVAKADYKLTIGLVELLAAALLLFRRTAALGALMAVGIILNVVLADFAYNTGDQYFSLYLMAISLFLLAHNIPEMYRLTLEKPAVPNMTKLELTRPWQIKARPILKGIFILLLLTTGTVAYLEKKQSPLRLHGLPDAAGLYDVAEFKLNGTSIPYSRTNPHRWQNVVFENWPALSIQQYNPAVNGRISYSFRIDSTSEMLYVQKTPANRANIEMTLKYSRPDTSTIILSGRTSSSDSIYAVLKKLNKKYLLIQGRRKPIEL